VADPRVKCAPWAGAYGVTGWEAPSATVTGSSAIDNRPVSVADPRGLLPKKRYSPGCLGVVPWNASMGTVCGENQPQNGAFNVADPRVKHAFDRGYSVVPWDSPANTIAGGTAPGQGAYSVADPRTTEAPAGWLTLDDVMVFLETPGPWAIVDRSSDGPPLAIIHDLAKAPPILVRIVARDGTWHRPLTPLELAVIQGLPAVHNGAPLVLAGTMTEIRESIGDMVPPGAAQAWGEVSLLALGQHDLSAFSLSGGGGDVWVDPQLAMH
jgi:site-specific DNA-cytosine methylase